jgi:16S rRNA (adenine1518-N6/adenine1519-N6)-dimethyltransferase
MATHGRRRALGQHFLCDTQICNQIADTALEEAQRHFCSGLLEIGPGKGAITLPILERLERVSSIKNFKLVERDQKLAQEWKEKFQSLSEGNRSVETGDFLDVQRENWLISQSIAVVSNLPYSAGTAILIRLAEEAQSIPVMVLMFQAEVAKRLRAGPSGDGRGSLSVWIQNQWDVKSLVRVPPQAFSPPPEVQSEVVVLTRRQKPWIDVFGSEGELKTWQMLLKAAFAHRRKMLRSTFPWPQALKASDVDPTLRAEALDWAEWERLFQAVLKYNA